MNSTSKMFKTSLGGGLSLLLMFTLASQAAEQVMTTVAAGGPTAPKPQLLKAYGKLPLRFELNQGQTDPQVKYLSRGRGYTLFLTATDAVLALRTPVAPGAAQEIPAPASMTTAPAEAQSSASAVVRMKLVGANPSPPVVGLEKLPGTSNYFIGNDPKQWRVGIAHYAKVQYEGIYPGIDLIYYGNQGHLEYDFVVAPGADPEAIRLGIHGVETLDVDEHGTLIAHTAAGDLRLRKPLIYQEIDGVKQEISGGYRLKGKNQVAFQVAAYDHSRPLIIDPVLIYSTYLGGSGNDGGTGVAVDASGNAYVTGLTGSANFPGTAGGFSGSDVDAFVTKIDAAGTAILYSTYLGGNGSDAGLGIAVDAWGNAYVAGTTSSTNFPVTGGIQPVFGGFFDAFVTKINAAGAILFSTYLGSTDLDTSGVIAVDAWGNAYVTGQTRSATLFPGTIGSPIQSAFGGNDDAFVTKINAAGTAILFSTYLGGSGLDSGGDIAVDAWGNAYVTGTTRSTNFPGTIGSPIQSAFGGGALDGFVTKINAVGTAILFSTYLGSGGQDQGFGIAVDASGNAYVTGLTGSTTNFPGTAGSPIQSAFGGGPFDAFVTKVNAAGTALVYSTYLGSGGNDNGVDIAVDASGNAYVTGVTGSTTTFPGTAGSPIQSVFGGGTFDGFVTKVNAAGTAILFSTYLGGSGNDNGFGIAVDASGDAYVTGTTGSTNFPGTAGSPIQSAFVGGPFDAFVAKIAFDSDGDGILNAVDNCPTVFNPGQEQTGNNVGGPFGDACVDPSVDIPDNADVAPDVTIGAGTTINKGVVIASGAEIGENVDLNKNSSVGENTVIGDNTVINQGVSIGSDVVIGVNVVIDKGVIIGNGVMIGDNTVIGQRQVSGPPITIDDNAVLGMNVTLGKNVMVNAGVCVADGTTVGQNQIVSVSTCP